jgi:hypothetical protein
MTANKGDKTTVNIRVSANTWEDLSDENRSEICREALRSASQLKRDAGQALKYASEYEAAIAERDEAQARVQVKKMMLTNELEGEGYEQLVLDGALPDQFSTFEEMVTYSGKYARSYLEAGRDLDWTANAIMQDMRDEGKILPIGIAEWIADLVYEDMDFDELDVDDPRYA